MRFTVSLEALCRKFFAQGINDLLPDMSRKFAHFSPIFDHLGEAYPSNQRGATSFHLGSMSTPPRRGVRRLSRLSCLSHHDVQVALRSPARQPPTRRARHRSFTHTVALALWSPQTLSLAIKTP